MNVLVTGSTGLVGSAVVPGLAAAGHRVTRLVRSRLKDGELWWDPAAGKLDGAALEGIDGVVHLAGENIGTRRWSAAKKARIFDSRVKGTRLLSETLAGLAKPPGVLVCASGVGHYGSRGEEILREESAPGSGFLAELTQEWEAAARPAAEAGVRAVQLRLGIVLSSTGGALAKMLPVFRLGVGGSFGSGRQYVSWITLDDVVGVVGHALVTDGLRGPVNAVAPDAVTNREFTKALGRAVGRPTVLRTPALVLRLAFGELAEATLLTSARAESARLLASGYRFRHPELEPALRDLLDRGA